MNKAGNERTEVVIVDGAGVPFEQARRALLMGIQAVAEEGWGRSVLWKVSEIAWCRWSDRTRKAGWKCRRMICGLVHVQLRLDILLLLLMLLWKDDLLCGGIHNKQDVDELIVLSLALKLV